MRFWIGILSTLGMVIFLCTSAPSLADGGGPCQMCRNWKCQDPAIVRKVQQALHDKGETIEPDGSFGEKTQIALDSFAKKNGLSDTRPRTDALLRKLFVGKEYETVRKRIYSACVY